MNHNHPHIKTCFVVTNIFFLSFAVVTAWNSHVEEKVDLNELSLKASMTLYSISNLRMLH